MMKKASQVSKALRLLRDHAGELLHQGPTIPLETFFYNLNSSGVVKPARLWVPSVSIKDIVTGTGLDLDRSKTAGAALEEFMSLEVDDEEPGGDPDLAPAISEVHDVTVGYPCLSLHHWLNKG